MTITKKTVANKLAAYLGHELTLGELVKWAEHAMQDGTFKGKDAKLLATVIGRLGAADVRSLSLAWEDFEQILKQLGYSARIDIVAA